MARWWRVAVGLVLAGALVALGIVLLMRDGETDAAPDTTQAAPPSTSTSVPVTEPPVTTTTLGVTTTVATTTTTLPTDPEIAWSAIEAERDVINYLAALAAGAYEQAAWSAHGNGIQMDGQADDETPAEYLERVCAGGSCDGPYEVVAEGPGIVDPQFAQASSLVTVTHVDSGEVGTIRLGTFEGQRVIAQLPPLVASGERVPDLLTRLFRGDPPARVVIQRFNAFEIWEDGESEWVTHWRADEVFQVEGDVAAAFNGVSSLRDPSTVLAGECPTLMVRDGEVLVLDRCFADQAALLDPVTGDERELPVSLEPGEDGEFAFYAERGGVVLSGTGDAEGNLVSLQSQGGVDLLEEDYAGLLAISTDGEHVAYVDHADGAAFSHFWSPVLVVREIATGNKVLRSEVGNAIICVEFAGDWVVVCESNDDLASGAPEQVALVAIDIQTGESTRVETPVRVFLPS